VIKNFLTPLSADICQNRDCAVHTAWFNVLNTVVHVNDATTKGSNASAYGQTKKNPLQKQHGFKLTRVQRMS